MERDTEKQMAEGLTIGIPRAMLYYRCHMLWETFFHELGIRTVTSGATSRETFLRGAARSVDESCLSQKIFFGHVEELIGKCDMVLIPRIVNFGRRREFCVRFEALPDIARNSFRDTDLKILSYNIDCVNGNNEEEAFAEMGRRLGLDRRSVAKAYRSARKEDQNAWKARVRAEEEKYRQDGIRILIAGHSYVYSDPYFGEMIEKALKKLGTIPIRADLVNRKKALEQSDRVSPTCKWEMNREILGSVALHQENIDGIVIVSAFPCGPDAMVDDLLTRKVKNVPVLNMVLDSQSGVAGVETRLESFVDILRFRRGDM